MLVFDYETESSISKTSREPLVSFYNRMEKIEVTLYINDSNLFFKFRSGPEFENLLKLKENATIVVHVLGSFLNITN